jgi:hypothetical protein
MSIKNARTLGVRLDEKTTARVAAFEEKTHIEGVSLARASLLAALDYFDATGTLSLPLRITEANPSQKDPTPLPTRKPVIYETAGRRVQKLDTSLNEEFKAP